MKPNFQALYNQAYEAGMNAMYQTKTTPMVVGSETHFGSNQIDYNKPTYFVQDGVCGFAWVVIKPANSGFAKWLVQSGLGRKHYNGGVSYWVHDGRQSVQLKEAFAYAFANVLSENGIRAYADSRLD